MRKIVVYELVSLDGVAEPPDRFLDWDDSIDARPAALIATQDAVILGRRSYDEWVGFWPSSQIEPFATFINGVTKYVATSTPLDRDWANAAVIDGGLVEFVRDLKQQPGGDVGVHASISVAQALLAADVVDELRLVIGADDRRPRTTTPRRLATNPARIDPKRDLTDRLSARRLSRHPIRGPAGPAAVPQSGIQRSATGEGRAGPRRSDVETKITRPKA